MAHGGNKDWEKAIADAQECIKIAPTFVKGGRRARALQQCSGHSRTTPPTTGYYRLATAQVELHQYDVAANTIKQGFEHDSGAASALVSRSAQRPVISRWHKPLFCRSESGAQQAHAYRQGASSAGAREAVGRHLTERARRQRRPLRPRPHGGLRRVFPRARWTRARAKR